MLPYDISRINYFLKGKKNSMFTLQVALMFEDPVYGHADEFKI